MALLKVQVVLMLLSSAWMLASNPDKDDAANQMWNNLIMKVDDALIMPVSSIRNCFPNEPIVVAEYGPPEFIEFWNSLTDDEFETITTVMDEVKQSWSSAAEAIVRVYGDGFWAGRYTIIRTEFHRRIDILPLQWRKIMAEIVDSILTFNEMRFLRAFLAFKELPANGRKRIYEEFPWMRKMMHLYGWGGALYWFHRIIYHSNVAFRIGAESR
ncbi:unnamed protein product [Toxocara canis]|uniref:Uncharacterized protein n=1 Tax=Toxocara canis TaxID=6265 RepID=A0A183V3G4_TOXCA|nr:unnamed protein product [Toxocara canis]